jgi:hypothetical protein
LHPFSSFFIYLFSNILFRDKVEQDRKALFNILL